VNRFKARVTGVWGTGIFLADDALELAADVYDAADPGAFIENFLASFVGRTIDGFDHSEYAGQWSKACEVLAAVEIVRWARRREGAGSRLPVIVAERLGDRGYEPSYVTVELARLACQRVAGSSILKQGGRQLHAVVAGSCSFFGIELGR